MQTKHLCVLIRILTKRFTHRETGLSPPVKYINYLLQGGAFLWIICIISVLCLLCFRTCLFLIPCGHLLGKADLLDLVCEV